MNAVVAENDRLRAWVADLQSGQYVNCVYCGHRYGPGETTPVSVADALKAHVATCAEHPLAKLKVVLEAVRVVDVYGILHIGVTTDEGCWSVPIGPACRPLFESWARDRDAALAALAPAAGG